MRHEESNLQRQCVAWFRAQYPQYAMLLTHVANEGNGNRVTGAIRKAEGTVAGVPDLLLFIPAQHGIMTFSVLGIEFKTKTGKQSQGQKDFERYFLSAANVYVVVRSLEEFQRVIKNWLNDTPQYIKNSIASTHQAVQEEAAQREREKFYKVIGKK